MAFDLRLTTAGLAALADGDNTGSAAVTFSHIALGDGSGPGGAADDARVALRSERDRAAVLGSDAIDRRIALRATFMPAAAYAVTEIGLYGSVSGGATTLYGYWSDSGAVVAQTAAGTTTVIAATLDFIAAAADVAVTVDASIQLGGAVIPATTERRGTVELSTLAEGRTDDDERAVTPYVMGVVVDEKITAATQDAASAAGLEAAVQSQALLSAAQVQLSERVAVVEGNTRSATTERSGIVELTTDEEAITGDDDQRSMTAHSTRAAASATVASLLGAIPEDGTKYALQGGASGALTLVRLAIVALAAGGTSTVTIPATDPYPGGVYGSSVGSGQNISIGGVSSWEIPADGDYTVAFTMRRTTNVNSGSISGQLYRQRGGSTVYLSQSDITTFGAMGGSALFCGALEAGDIITVRHAHAGSTSRRDSTGRTINVPRVSRERYRCPVLAILRHEST